MNAHEPVLSETESTRAWQVALWVQIVLITVGWVSLCLLSGMPGGHLSVDLLIFGMLIWQCAMLGFWAGFGQWRWRWSVIALTSPLIGVVCSIAAGGELLEFQVFCLGIIGVVLLTLLPLRRWKGRIRKVVRDDNQADGLQFGIKHVFVWATTIAVFMGAGRFSADYLRQLSSLSIRIDTLVMILGLAACTSLATVVNIWAMLGDRVSIIKVLALLIITAGAMLGNHLLMDNHEFLFPGMVLVSQTLILVTMLFRRMAATAIREKGGGLLPADTGRRKETPNEC